MNDHRQIKIVGAMFALMSLFGLVLV